MFSLFRKNRSPNNNNNNNPERSNAAFRGTVLIGGLGIVFLFLYSMGIDGPKSSLWSIFSFLVLIAVSSFSVGGIIGFLFGIPHKLQNNNSLQAGTTVSATSNTATSQSVQASNYSDNTNLEQISDWLTKILVGVGLTQIHKILARFNQLCIELGYAAQSLTVTSSIKPTHSHSATIIGAIIIAFSIDGFLIVYLWTRLFLAKIESSSLNEIINDQIKNNDLHDKKAISVANKQLNLPVDVPDLSADELYEAFKDASGNVISSIFYRAVSIRKLYWASDKKKMERTIPIFRILIKLDSKTEFPENFAELGHALKDKINPEYTEALDSLTKSIEGFTKIGNTAGIAIIYFNRAYCRIQLDAEYKSGSQSTLENAKLIKADLTEARKESAVKLVVDTDPVVVAWEAVNP